MKTTHVRGSRPGFLTYAALIAVFVSAAFPLYWSFIIGSGDSSSLRERPWWPGGNFIDNALSVVSNPAVNFWPVDGVSVVSLISSSPPSRVAVPRVGHAKPSLGVRWVRG